MNGIELSASDLLSIFTHVKKWVNNLQRAGDKRRKESKDALRSVIKAVRKTTIYTRHLKDGNQKSIKKEEELSFLWTDLSFQLEDLKLNKLAKRCRIKGKYWADPNVFSNEFLEKAGIRLSDIERLALISLQELEK